MPLTFKAKVGHATFTLVDGALTAEWTLRAGMSEEELLDALTGMLRYLRQQPAPADVVPLHVVPTSPKEQIAEEAQAYEARMKLGQSLGLPTMSWAPAVKPVPLQDSLERAQASGFEPIPPDELED